MTVSWTHDPDSDIYGYQLYYAGEPVTDREAAMWIGGYGVDDELTYGVGAGYAVNDELRVEGELSGPECIPLVGTEHGKRYYEIVAAEGIEAALEYMNETDKGMRGDRD